MYTSTLQSGPLSANAALPPHPQLQTSYPPICLCPLTTVSCSWRSFYAFCFLSPLTLSGFFYRMLEVFESGALNYFTFSRLILSTLCATRNPILTHLPLFRFLDSLLCILIAPTSGLAFSPDATHASGGVVIFVRQGLSFSELTTSSLSSLDPYSDYVEVNISLNNSSSVSFLNVYTSLFAPSRRMAEPIPILPPFFPFPEISLFWGTSIAITPSGTQKVLLTPTGRMYLTGSSLLTSSPSMILTHPPFSIAPPLTFPLLHSLSPFLVPGRCFKSWVLTIYQFLYLSLSLRSFAPTSVPFPSTFRKLAGMTLPPTLTLTALLQRNTRLFLFPLLLLSLLLWH